VKLTVFQSDKGDCLLLESADAKRILVDGGVATSYREHVADTLGALRDAGEELDLVYVSHIDEDHIEGILALMEDEVAWRVHDFQVAGDNPGRQPPKVRRPPVVREVWHNGFSDLLGRNTKPIAELLAQTAAVLDLGAEDGDRALATRHRDLGSSVGQGVTLSKRLGPRQLNIPLNQAFGGKLAFVRDDGPTTITRGSLTITVIGPFEVDLAILREKWNAWLRANKTQLAGIRARMRADIDRLGTAAVTQFRAASELQAAELGDRSEVTAPNLASLMLLVEENGKTVLLTGDGHEDDILRGLERSGHMQPGGALHVDVLKLQHHGAENNISEKMAGRVTADHYVICGNGSHHNPDLRVLDVIFDARLGAAAPRPFKLWFNSSSTSAPAGARRDQMRKVEQRVAARAAGNPGAFDVEFLDDHSFDVPV
jgi:hypothetical protein